MFNIPLHPHPSLPPIERERPVALPLMKVKRKGPRGADGESEAVLYAGERSHQRGHIRAHRLGLFTFEQHPP